MSLQSGSCLDTSSDEATAAAGLPSPNVIRIKNRESEAWYSYEDASDGGTEDGTPPRGAPARGNPSSGSSTPTKSASGHRPGRNDDAKRLAMAAGGDPNDWYARIVVHRR